MAPPNFGSKTLFLIIIHSMILKQNFLNIDSLIIKGLSKKVNIQMSLLLGKPVSAETDEFPENFIAIFFALETVIFVMNFRKNFKKGGGHFRSEKFHCKFSAGATGLRKKSQ